MLYLYPILKGWGIFLLSYIKPYHPLCFIALVMLFCTTGIIKPATQPAHLDVWLWYRVIALLLLLQALLYVLLRNILFSVLLQWIHVVLTSVLSVVLAVVSYGIQSVGLSSGKLGTLQQVLTVFFALTQILFVINILLGLFARATGQLKK